MHHSDNATATDLYLVRLWKRKFGNDGAQLHGKLQHVVSGASCYFDGLSSLPDVLEEMMAQAPGSFGPDTEGLLGQKPDERSEDQHKGD